VLLLGIIVVALAIFAIVEAAGVPAATPYSAFLDQLDAGNVASVTFKGTEIDGLFKHPVNAAASNRPVPTRPIRCRLNWDFCRLSDRLDAIGNTLSNLPGHRSY
jgi:hypothetical protein